MYTHYYNPKYHLGKTRTIRSRMPVLHPGRVSDVSSLVVMRGIFLLSILNFRPIGARTPVLQRVPVQAVKQSVVMGEIIVVNLLNVVGGWKYFCRLRYRTGWYHASFRLIRARMPVLHSVPLPAVNLLAATGGICLLHNFWVLPSPGSVHTHSNTMLDVTLAIPEPAKPGCQYSTLVIFRIFQSPQSWDSGIAHWSCFGYEQRYQSHPSPDGGAAPWPCFGCEKFASDERNIPVAQLPGVAVGYDTLEISELSQSGWRRCTMVVFRINIKIIWARMPVLHRVPVQAVRQLIVIGGILLLHIFYIDRLRAMILLGPGENAAMTHLVPHHCRITAAGQPTYQMSSFKRTKTRYRPFVFGAVSIFLFFVVRAAWNTAGTMKKCSPDRGNNTPRKRASGMKHRQPYGIERILRYRIGVQIPAPEFQPSTYNLSPSFFLFGAKLLKLNIEFNYDEKIKRTEEVGRIYLQHLTIYPDIIHLHTNSPHFNGTTAVNTLPSFLPSFLHTYSIVHEDINIKTQAIRQDGTVPPGPSVYLFRPPLLSSSLHDLSLYRTALYIDIFARRVLPALPHHAVQELHVRLAQYASFHVRLAGMSPGSDSSTRISVCAYLPPGTRSIATYPCVRGSITSKRS
ncbi:hypothetical protein C8R43DRAFT_959450 [Mycena crocata]|nr:hypothetical protein C8R43DRAFT_959450 [Mycena crocata]